MDTGKAFSTVNFITEFQNRVPLVENMTTKIPTLLNRDYETHHTKTLWKAQNNIKRKFSSSFFFGNKKRRNTNNRSEFYHDNIPHHFLCLCCLVFLCRRQGWRRSRPDPHWLLSADLLTPSSAPLWRFRMHKTCNYKEQRKSISSRMLRFFFFFFTAQKLSRVTRNKLAQWETALRSTLLQISCHCRRTIFILSSMSLYSYSLLSFFFAHSHSSLGKLE